MNLGPFVIGLSAAGALNALFFLLVTHGAMRPDPRWLPAVCRMDEATCARIIDTPYARVFGLSNAAYGLAWYILAAAAGLALMMRDELPYARVLLVAAAMAVALSAYLAHALVFRLRTPCPLCFLGHGINVALFALFASEFLD